MNFGGAVTSAVLGGIMNYSPVSKYSGAELKLAMGTTLKTSTGEEGTLLEVNNTWVILEVGKFLSKKHREFSFHEITYVPIVENMYKTKLGKLSRI